MISVVYAERALFQEKLKKMECQEYLEFLVEQASKKYGAGNTGRLPDSAVPDSFRSNMHEEYEYNAPPLLAERRKKENCVEVPVYNASANRSKKGGKKGKKETRGSVARGIMKTFRPNE